MKNSIRVLAFLFLSFANLQSEEFELYLLAGQSNMDGRGKVAKLNEEQRVPSKHAIIYYRNPPKSSDGWKPLGPGYSVAPKYKGDLPSQTFGPELGFVAALSKAQPKKKFALIKGSKGGSSLRVDWNPGIAGDLESQGPRYRYFIETIKMAKVALAKEGHTAKLRGLLWHQGESDSKTKTELHQKRLAQFMARIREDTGEKNLPIVLGEVFDNGKRDKVRAAILGASKADRFAGFVSAEGTSTWDAGTHFDAKSQLLLGERYAEVMIELFEKEEDLPEIDQCARIGPEFRSALYLSLACQLQGMGREKAIQKLSGWARTRKYEHQVVILCRMLYEPKEGGVFRGPALGGPGLPGGTETRDWPKVPITITKGVPILLTRGYTLFGRAELSRSYLAYCEKDCHWSGFRFEMKSAEVISQTIDDWLEEQAWSESLEHHERKFFDNQG